MESMENKIDIIENNIQACLAKKSSASYFTYGNIPKNRYWGACKKYLGDVKYEEVIGMIDTTIFGGGERGLVFTFDGVYFRDTFGKPIYCSYENSSDFPDISDLYFDGTGVRRMLQKLRDVDTVNSDNGGFLDGLFSVVGSVIKGFGEVYLQEQEYQEKRENEEILQLLKDFENSIKIIKNDLELKDYEEIETQEELIEAFFTSFLIASIYIGDEEWYKELGGDDEGNEDDIDVGSMGSILVHINDFINMAMDGKSREQNFIIYGVERYGHRMKAIYEEICDSERVKDLEQLYERMYKVIIDFKNHLNKVNSVIDELIDECYESLSYYDE